MGVQTKLSSSLRKKVLDTLEDKQLLETVSISILEFEPQDYNSNNLGDFKGSVPSIEDNIIVSLNGDTVRYPASIIKLFWAYQALIELPNSAELDYLLELMLRDSSDRAGQLVVEMLTGPDPETPKDYEEAYKKRLKLETFWKPFEFKELKAAHKTFLNDYTDFDSWIKTTKSPNTVTSEMVIRLWQQIWTNEKEPKLTEQKRNKLLNWLKRKPINKNISTPTTDSFYENPPGKNHSQFQASLIGHNLTEDTEFYSKSGWRDNVVNDTGFWIDNGSPIIFAVFGAHGFKVLRVSNGFFLMKDN